MTKQVVFATIQALCHFMKESELAKNCANLLEKVRYTEKLVGIEKMTAEKDQLQATMTSPEFWSNQTKAKVVGQRVAALEKEINQWQTLEKDAASLLEIVSLDQDDRSVSLRAEGESQLAELEQRFAALEFAVLFSGPYDERNAVVAIHAGAGGVDAQDWAEMLLRMITRFCERHDFTVNVLDQSRGSEAGIKSIFLEVTGRHAYGWLKSENGVHRLVRISPFDAEKMRHTSFALIEVIPELDDVGAVELKDEDLRIDVFRAGGHGGQSVNTTDSAVRIVHIPTGITVTCQNERSQLQNKTKALQVLASKLHQYAQAQREEERAVLRGEFTEAAWGNQARSYVIHPYKMVKDHRSGFETSDTQSILDGELEPVVEAYLKSQKGARG